MQETFVLKAKKTIKKVVAISTAVAMLGSTMTSALALDLGEYPGPFVKSGVYDPSNAFVLGDEAKGPDTFGALDIAANLQFESKVCSAAGAGAVNVVGDAASISTNSDLLELRESLGDVRETMSEFDLDGLRGGSVTTNEGRTEYNQYLRFNSSTLAIGNPPLVNFTENDEPVEKVGDFMVVQVGGTNATNAFFEYELQFEEGLESTIASAKLSDLDDESLVILGQTYVFIDTSVDTTNNEVKLELLGGAIYDVLEEGEKKSYTIKGKTYEVQVVVITDQNPETVVFRVNGEQTKELDDGEVEILSDGTLLGISEVISNEAGEAGGGDIVEFYIGANKLEIEDKEYTDSVFESRVKIDNEPLEDAWVEIDANELSSTELELTSIKYRLVADSLPGLTNIYVPPGHGIREYLDEPQGLLGQNWDLRYEGLDDTGVSVIKIDPQGDDEYRLEFTNQLGQLYRIPYLTNKGGVFKFGDDDDDLVFSEGFINTSSNVNASNLFFNIDPNDYFVLSKQESANATDETATSHIVRYTSIDTSNNQITVDDLATGTREFTYSTTGVGNSTVTIGKVNLLFGGNTFQAFINNNASTGFALAVDQNGDGVIGSAVAPTVTTTGVEFSSGAGFLIGVAALQEVKVTVRGGGVLDLGNHTLSHGVDPRLSRSTDANIQGGLSLTNFSEPGSNLTLVTVNSEFDENGPLNNGGDEILVLEIQTRTNNELGTPKGAIKYVDNGTSSQGVIQDYMTRITQYFVLEEPDDDEDHHLGMTDYGVKVDLYEPSGTTEAETTIIEYPLAQRGAQVFVTMGSVAVSTATAGQSCTVQDITPVTRTASEVSGTEKAHNLIVVGGPCANSVVSSLFGMSCTGWSLKPGEGVIKLVQNGNKVAVLVAGTNADDTKRAAMVLANAKKYKAKLAGKTEVVVKGTTEEASSVE